MSPEVIGTLVNGAIPFLGGIYATLLSFRVVGKKPGVSAKYDEWHSRYCQLLRILGPALVAFGVFLWLTGIAQVSDLSAPGQAQDWKRYATSDDVCSAEFPNPPKQDKKTSFGIESNRLTLNRAGPDIYYMLTFSDMPPDAPEATDEERLDSVRDNMPAFGDQMGMKFEFVREDKLSEGGVHGTDLVFAAGNRHTCRMKVFILRRRIYRQIAVTPRYEPDDEATKRFRSSFRLEKVGK